ncbi:MAG: F0F1 ATP synthase subunit gamma [Streptococcaceae bacterium]|nr:F0F1 ATP synthase subunit gamma [Streptococcaceae bacterium]
MGASLNEIKTRIASTKKTSQITNAMQMVSGAKLNKSERLSKDFQVYASKVRDVTRHLVAANSGESKNTLLIKRPVKKTGYIIITGDKGLVGGYNSTILKQTLQMFEQDHKKNEEIVILAIGSVGSDFFKSRDLNIAYELRGVSDHPSFDEVRNIVQNATNMYQEELFDELYVCYNHHVNSLTSRFRVERMLPIYNLDTEDVDEFNQPFILEPSEEEILDVLLPQYAESLIYGAIVDAKTAEHAAGMTAMKTATDNAKNIIADLTISYNRARQAAITQEITEIVGGAAALE